MESFYRKLVSLGKEKVHDRYKTMLVQCRCKNCRHFFALYAASNFNPAQKPIVCPKCRQEDPLDYTKDPLEVMLVA